MRLLSTLAFALALSTVTLTAAAQTAWRPAAPNRTLVVSFDSVESVSAGVEGPNLRLRIMGRTSTTTSLVQRTALEPAEALAACHRQALLAMTRPGQYRLRLFERAGFRPYCELSRR